MVRTEFFGRHVYICGVKTTPPQYNGFEFYRVLRLRAGIKPLSWVTGSQSSVFDSSSLYKQKFYARLIYFATLSVKSKLHRHRAGGI